MIRHQLRDFHPDQLREVALVIHRELVKAGRDVEEVPRGTIAEIERIAIISLLAGAALAEVTRYPQPPIHINQVEVVEAERPE